MVFPLGICYILVKQLMLLFLTICKDCNIAAPYIKPKLQKFDYLSYIR